MGAGYLNNKRPTQMIYAILPCVCQPSPLRGAGQSGLLAAGGWELAAGPAAPGWVMAQGGRCCLSNLGDGAGCAVS